jgi:signal transduction histidine kinase
MAAEREPGRLRRVTDSVRFRVTALATLAVIVVLVVSALALVAGQRRLLRDDLEDRLRQAADGLAAGAPGQVVDDDGFYQVVDPEGAVHAASANLAGLGPVADAPAAGAAEVVRTGDVPAVDDERFLIVTRRLADGGVVHAGAPLDDVEEAADTLAAVLAILVPLIVALLAIIVWWLVGRTLRPVEAIREEVEHVRGDDLDRRVPVPASHDEIAELARTMNAMLDRVSDATRTQQRFVADASHELRSPLTRMRSELEVDLAHPERADPLATHRSVLAETVALQRLVDDLLHLARRDAGALPRRAEPVDLDDLVLHEAALLRAMTSPPAVDLRQVSAAQVTGDRDQLGRAVHNLAENAARHATRTVTFALTERDGTAVLEVGDDGPGIPEGERERAFERFTRLDEARTPAAGGTGLGLAITREIVQAHGGRITIDPARPTGTTFVVVLPIDHASSSSRVTNGVPPSS